METPERQLKFVLAEKLSMTVDELEDKMSFEEFLEWSCWLKIQSEKSQHGSSPKFSDHSRR